MVKHGREEGALLYSGQNRKHLSISFSNDLVGVLAGRSFSVLLTVNYLFEMRLSHLVENKEYSKWKDFSRYYSLCKMPR